MQKTNGAADVKAAIDQQDDIKKRAAKQAAKREQAPEQHEKVECTVLPMGDGKVSMGHHVGGIGEAHHEEGETFIVDLPIALALYERGFVNFPGSKEAFAQVRAEREQFGAAAISRQRAQQAAYDKLIGEGA
jgi:hypothetical protein